MYKNWTFVFGVGLVVLVFLLIFYPNEYLHISRPISILIFSIFSIIVIRIFVVRKEFFTEISYDERMLRLAIENVNDGIIITDTVGNILDCNNRITSLLRVNKKTILDTKVQEIIHLTGFEYGTTFIEIFRKIIEQKESFILKNLNLSVPNTEDTIKIEDSISPIINEKNMVIGAIIILHDITSSVDIQEKNIILNEKLNQLDRTDVLNNFLLGISQSFGDWISSIYSNMEMIKSNCNDERSQYMFDNIEKEVFDAKDFIKKLTIFNSKNEFERIPADLNKLIASNRLFMLKILTKNSLDINVDLKAENKVNVDTLDFDRIFIGIISDITDQLDGNRMSISTYDNGRTVMEIKIDKKFELKKYDFKEILERNDLTLEKSPSSIKILF